MPKAHPGVLAFNSGELSPQLDGRVDIAKYASGCRILENAVAMVPGGATKRPGARYVRDCWFPSSSRLIPFEFSRTQAYVLDMTLVSMVPHRNGSPVLEAGKAITGITNANPGVVTAVGHGLSPGDQVYISGVSGMPEVNGNFFIVQNVTADTFSLRYRDVAAGTFPNVDTTNWGVYTLNGTVQAVYYAIPPQLTLNLSELRWIQSADVLYLLSPQSPVLRLERYAHDEWQFVEARGAELENAVPITAITKANPAVVTTSTAHGYATGDLVFLSRVRGMRQVAGRYFQVGTVPSATTFQLRDELTGANYDSTNNRAFVAGGSPTVQRVKRFAFPPFRSENINREIIVLANAEDEGATVSIVATQPIFASTQVGGYLKLREVPGEQHPLWEPKIDFTDWKSGGLNVGDFCRYEGNVYELSNKNAVAQTGTNPPVHTIPGEVKADSKWSWEYAHSGSGFLRITSFTDDRRVTGRIIRRLPKSLTDSAGFDPVAITGATQANPCSVTMVGHPYATGDRLLILDVGGMTQLNGRVFTITKTGANTFTLDGIDSTTYGAYTAGGKAYRVANITTAQAATHRWSHGAFSAQAGYPRAATFFEDRLVLAGTALQPQTLWTSVTGDYENHEPKPTDDSALVLTLNTDQVNAIEWLYGGKQLYIGTIGGEFVAGGIAPEKPIGLSNPLHPVRMTSYGSRENLLPVSVGNRVVYVERGGRRLREMVYDFESDAYQGPDLTVLAEHLAAPGKLFGWIDYQAKPHSIVWDVRGDGVLIGLTYDPLQQVIGLHRHPIAGASGGSVVVEDVAVIPHPDGDEDQVWLLVKRTLPGGVVRRSVEYLEKFWNKGDAIANAHYMDQGVTYSGAPATTIFGLVHAEGLTVSVLADGVPVADALVTNGKITLGAAASVVQVGYKVRATLEPMRIEAGAADGTAQGKTKRVSRIVARLFETGAGLSYGPADDLTKMDPLTMKEHQDPSGAAVSLWNGDTRDLAFPGGYEQEGRMVFKHVEALPFTLLALFPRVTTEDR